jgi:predicted ArsR family transcriptional regulator
MANAGKIIITKTDRSYLESLLRARTMQAQTVQRARIILLRAEGISIDTIADKVGINRKSVMLCLTNIKEAGFYRVPPNA